jgi:hypothetical protein
MKKPFRNIVTLLIMVIYILINLGSLAPLALKSPRLAHELTGECAGNCDICGCSAERRANHTCCCFLKKKHQHDQENVPDCCKNKKVNKTTILTCNCPCGNNKHPGLPGAEKSEQLPYRFTEGTIALAEDTLVSFHQIRLTDRHGDPPDPPPKLLVLS